MRKILLAVCGAWMAASAAPKFIAHGWDLLDATPANLLANAAAFGATSLDGVTVCVPPTKQADGSEISSVSLPQDAPWRYGTLAPYEPALKALPAHPSLRENFLLCLWHFRRGWLALTDDAAWARFANNLRVFARLAKRGGLKGLFIDAEDYTKERPFRRSPADPGYDEASRIARRRGREAFAGVFAEFPDATILSFWFFTQCGEALSSPDPAAAVRQTGDLWPHFLNGMLDVMPMTATLVDGDEAAYKYDSAEAFANGAIRQLFKALPLVAPENRDKFRARMRIGFGQYMDMYVNEQGKSGSWYFGPAAGSRLEHFRRNLAAAAGVADYVWLYGEKRAWIDWRAPGDFRQSRGYDRHGTWEARLPGFAETLDELRDPQGAARRRADRLRAAGAQNLYTANLHRRWTAPKTARAAFAVADGAAGAQTGLAFESVKDGAYHVPVDGVKAGETYVVDMWQYGEPGGVAELIWRTGGPFNWKLGRHRMTPGGPDGLGRRRVSGIFHVPDGADGIMFRINARQADGVRARFEDIAIFRVGKTSAGDVK